jgi:hypothetical protein
MVHDCTGDNLHQGQMVLEASVCSALAPTGMAEGSHDMTAPSPIYAPVSNDWVPPSGECNGVATLQGKRPWWWEVILPVPRRRRDANSLHLKMMGRLLAIFPAH